MGINKQNEDEDWFISIIAIFKWIKLFFAPFFYSESLVWRYL